MLKLTLEIIIAVLVIWLGCLIEINLEKQSDDLTNLFLIWFALIGAVLLRYKLTNK